MEFGYAEQRDDSQPGWDGARFCPNSMRFKTYEWFISGIFHLIFSDCGRLWVTETAETETGYKGGPLYHREGQGNPRSRVAQVQVPDL